MPPALVDQKVLPRQRLIGKRKQLLILK